MPARLSLDTPAHDPRPQKDNDLDTAGDRVTRFTADQIRHDPEDTLARTRRVLQ